MLELAATVLEEDLGRDAANTGRSSCPPATLGSHADFARSHSWVPKTCAKPGLRVPVRRASSIRPPARVQAPPAQHRHRHSQKHTGVG